MTKQAVNISPSTMPKPAEILKQQFQLSLGLPWSDILPESRLDELLEEEEISYRTRVYTPIVTLWAMLYQVLSPDKSLSNTLKCITTLADRCWGQASIVRYRGIQQGAIAVKRETTATLNPRNSQPIGAGGSRVPVRVWSAGEGF